MLTTCRADTILFSQSLTLSPLAIWQNGCIWWQEGSHICHAEFLCSASPHFVWWLALMAGDEGFAYWKTRHVHRLRVFRLRRHWLLFGQNCRLTSSVCGPCRCNLERHDFFTMFLGTQRSATNDRILAILVTYFTYAVHQSSQCILERIRSSKRLFCWRVFRRAFVLFCKISPTTVRLTL